MSDVKRLLESYKDNSIKNFNRKHSKIIEKFFSKNYPLNRSYGYKHLIIGCFQILYKGDVILQIEEIGTSNTSKLKISKDWDYDIDRDIHVRRMIEKNRNNILRDLLKFIEDEDQYMSVLSNKLSKLHEELLLIDWEEVININNKAYEMSGNTRTTVEEFEVAYSKYKQ